MIKSIYGIFREEDLCFCFQVNAYHKSIESGSTAVFLIPSNLLCNVEQIFTEEMENANSYQPVDQRLLHSEEEQIFILKRVKSSFPPFSRILQMDAYCLYYHIADKSQEHLLNWVPLCDTWWNTKSMDHKGLRNWIVLV